LPSAAATANDQSTQPSFHHQTTSLQSTTMFQSFTGNSRRPRQVNLSGRNPNPFAASSASKNALVNAQQERFLRKLERDRLSAAKMIQRVWRGHSCRTRTRNSWRCAWDEMGDRGPGWSARVSGGVGHEAIGPESFKQEDEFLADLRLLLYFADVKVAEDMRRLDWFVRRLLRTIETSSSTFTEERSRFLLLRLERLLLDALVLDMAPPTVSPNFTADALLLLVFLTRSIPKDTAQNANQYYRSLSRVTVRANTQIPHIQDYLLRSVLCPLEQITSKTVSAYEAFATAYLSTPNLQEYLGNFDSLMTGLNYKLLAMALAGLIRNNPGGRVPVPDVPNSEGLLWLLAYFIYSNQLIHGTETSTMHAPDPDYVAVVSTLLCTLADEISARIDIDIMPMKKGLNGAECKQGREASNQKRQRMPLPTFVRQKILSLVDQRSITSLLARTDGASVSRSQQTQGSPISGGADARHLAGYALTLLRVFPRRGDEIRMWLYLGSTSVPTSAAETPGLRLPAIKYFWKATQNTSVYRSIYKEQNAALDLLRPGNEAMLEDTEERDKEWGVILLFLELYTFVLKVMDDEEFLSGGMPGILGGSGFGSSWTRESALQLSEVKEMTVFLKNLAFTMYWNASDISGVSEPESTSSIGSYFNTTGTARGSTPRGESAGAKSLNRASPGLAGVTIDHVKGIVTGLLRMIYERE
jgi:ubiquitin-protein ligase E3 C